MNDLKQIPPGGYYVLSPADYSPLPLQEEKEVHLRDYWKVIQKRKWIVIAFFLIVLIATAVGTFTMEPVYRERRPSRSTKKILRLSISKRCLPSTGRTWIITRLSIKSLRAGPLLDGWSRPSSSRSIPSFSRNPKRPFRNGNQTSGLLSRVFSVLVLTAKMPPRLSQECKGDLPD